MLSGPVRDYGWVPRQRHCSRESDALLVASDPIFDVHRDKLVELVAAAAIPAIYQFRDFAAAGGLMSYDP